MEALYRRLLPVLVWLGILAFVVGIVLLLVHPDTKFLFLVPRGWVRGAQTFFLAAIALYCLIQAKEKK